jgi:hypothetical protein
MAKFGSNIKMSTARGLRDQTRAVFEGVLGCERQSPNDTIDLFGFDDGASLAVDYVDDGDVLTAEQHKKSGTWIELEVDDEEATAEKLAACEGVTSFEYFTGHRYFQLPGGQVFRLKR